MVIKVSVGIASGNESGVWSLNEIPDEICRRLPTGFIEVDMIYGKTDVPIIYNGRQTVRVEYGPVRGRISYWAGGHGVGKTRLAIALTKNVNAMGAKVIVFQGEVRPIEFKQWTGNTVKYPSQYFVSNYHNISKISNAIRKYKPHWVIIDSANTIDGMNSPLNKVDIFDELRKTVAIIGCHCIMVAQLNQDGTVKGGTIGPHLADVEVRLYKYMPPSGGRELPGAFYFHIGKNRYGPSEGCTGFIHNDFGIETLSAVQAKMLSK